MGCDYYHEAIVGDIEDPSDEPGELEIVLDVYDMDGDKVEQESVTVTVPVGGKVYIDRLPERPPIWAR